MNNPLTIRPTNSEAFEIGDKVATIVLEGDQLVIGDPCYGIEDKYAEYPFDPSSIPPAVTGYRVIKKSGAYYEVDNLEEAEALVKRKEGLGSIFQCYMGLTGKSKNILRRMRTGRPRKRSLRWKQVELCRTMRVWRQPSSARMIK